MNDEKLMTGSRAITTLPLPQPDKKLDEIWAEEAERRLKAYREGRLEGIPMEEILIRKK
ncbi:MAG: addiction module protein [Candidatus Omnitrophota bacterium]